MNGCTRGNECPPKIKTIENHQLPRDKGYLLTYREIKDAFPRIESIGLWKSNHPFSFDITYNTAPPALVGTAILTLSVSKSSGSVYLHLYGCAKAVLKRINCARLRERILPELARWLDEALALQERMPMHRMVVLEVVDDTGDLKLHRIEGA